MNNKFLCTKLAAAIGLILASSAYADGIRFEDFTPLAASAGPIPVGDAGEATPMTLGNPVFTQLSISDRATQVAEGEPNTGNWDMNTVNETGRNKSSHLFSVYETGQAGVQRINLATGQNDTVWISPAVGGHVAFDASYWTPWGTFITAEESWTTAAGGATSPYGRVFELKNPLTAPGIVGPVTAISNAGADFEHKNVIPRVSQIGRAHV